MLRADVEAEFLGRIIEVGDKRNVDDGRFVAEHEGRRRKPLVDDREIAVDAAFEKGQHRRIFAKALRIIGRLESDGNQLLEKKRSESSGTKNTESPK